MKTCECCGQTYTKLPPGTWLSRIGGWHRVRITHPDGPQYSSEEIGAGCNPQDAVDQAWRQWFLWAERAKSGICWWCNGEPDYWEEYDPEECPPCEVCDLTPPKQEKNDG